MKEITMPKLSDTMTEGTMVAWRKVVGARVERGEVVAEVETDKATMELESFASGVLLDIRVVAGQTVPVGTVIGIIGAPEEQPAAGGMAAATAPAPPSASLPETPVPAASPVPPRPAPPARSPAEDVLAAPVVRRRARELGIDLGTVAGSGPGGRILLEDLEPGPSRLRTAGLAPVPSPDVQPGAAIPAIAPGGEPLSRMRAAIARTVSESWRTIPHFSVTVEVRMDVAEQLLHRLRADGQPFSPTALLVRATALALRHFPRLNASLRDDQLIVHPEINVALAVRLDDGLLMPVLRDCAGLQLTEVAQRSRRLVERARHGQLSDSELSGGTFAISNLGMYGIDTFVALILPPMAAVLAVGAVRDGVVAEDRRPVVARLMSLTLSADHRVVDGAYAAEFLQELKHLLEQPDGLAD